MDHARDVAFLNNSLLRLLRSVRHEPCILGAKLGAAHRILLHVFDDLRHHFRGVLILGRQFRNNTDHAARHLEFDPVPVPKASFAPNGVGHHQRLLVLESDGHRMYYLSNICSFSVQGYARVMTTSLRSDTLIYIYVRPSPPTSQARSAQHPHPAASARI